MTAPRDPWAELNRAAETVRSVGEKVDKDRQTNLDLVAALEERTEASARKFRAWRYAGIIGLVLSVFALVGIALALYAVGEINDSRRSSRVAACRSYNKDLVTNVNALNDRNQDLLRNAVNNSTERTPAQQAATETFLADELAKYEAIKVPKRDCSPAGLEAFYGSK